MTALARTDAYPAMPEDGYGWEKLFSERMCRHFREDFGLSRASRDTTTFTDRWHLRRRGRSTGSALPQDCRGAMTGRRDRYLGRREQTRSFTYIDDCVEGTLLVTGGRQRLAGQRWQFGVGQYQPNGSMIEQIAGITVQRTYKLDAPLGVRGRNSDNDMIKRLYGWEPTVLLADGLERNYRWIYDQLKMRM